MIKEFFAFVFYGTMYAQTADLIFGPRFANIKCETTWCVIWTIRDVKKHISIVLKTNNYRIKYCFWPFESL